MAKDESRSTLVAQKKVEAEWIAVQYRPHVGMIIKCSSCDKQIGHGNPNPKFCPECGASMKNHADVPKGWGRALDSF